VTAINGPIWMIAGLCDPRRAICDSDVGRLRVQTGGFAKGILHGLIAFGRP